jgi:hypothetical protein
MTVLTSKERSKELNEIKRSLIDFKSLMSDDEFIIYKFSANLIYYIFDNNGFTKVKKTANFLKLEDFLNVDEYIKIDYNEIRPVVDLKKSEINDIFYDAEKFSIDTMISETPGHLIIEKQKDTSNNLKDIIAITSREKMERDFIQCDYNVNEQMLISRIDNKKYPYRITFSDDINFKLKIDNPESIYYVRTLNNGTFIQAITKSKYKDIYEAQTIIFVFNYLNNKEV